MIACLYTHAAVHCAVAVELKAKSQLEEYLQDSYVCTTSSAVRIVTFIWQNVYSRTDCVGGAVRETQDLQRCFHVKNKMKEESQDHLWIVMETRSELI